MIAFRGAKKFIVPFIALVAMSGYSQSTVTFNVDGAAAIVNKELFGLLMERLGRQWDGQGAIWVGTTSTTKNTNGMRQDVIDGFVECGIGAAEWPGGCAANGYSWSSNKNPSNAVGVDRFIQFCKLTGAEPVIAGKATSSDATSNLAFATYITNDLAYPLKWFKIGNEIWGGCGNAQTVDAYMANYTANYNQLKTLKTTANGKNLNVIAAAGAMEGSYDWITTYMNSIGSTIDAMEFHDYIYYPSSISSTNPTTANYWQIMKDVLVGDIHTHVYTNILPTMNSADAGKRVKVDLDEWGDWLENTGDGWMQTITLMDAISAGAHLNMFVRNADRFGVCCLAQGVNVIHSVININTSGVMVKTPTFYVFKLYKPHHTNGAKFAPMTASSFESTNSVPAMDAAATVDASGFVNVSLVNVDMSATRQAKVTLTSNKASYTVKSADVVTGPAYTSTNDFGAAEKVNIQTLAASNYSISGKTLSATLPAMSVAMFKLMPPDTIPAAVQSANFRNSRADAFSIKAGSRGTVLITSSANRKTPVTVSIYTTDGRSLLSTTSGMLQAGTTSLTMGSAIGKGAYIVTIAGQGVDFSRRMVVAR